MKVHLKRINEDVLMEAENEEGHRVRIDGSQAIGGIGGGFRPMQLVLVALGGCSAIDVTGILKKQRQNLTGLSITVEGERDSGEIPSVFNRIHLHYTLTGDLDRRKVEKALHLGIIKYCSVSEILNKTAHITYSYEIRE